MQSVFVYTIVLFGVIIFASVARSYGSGGDIVPKQNDSKEQQQEMSSEKKASGINAAEIGTKSEADVSAESSVDVLMHKAEQGDAAAQFHLGARYKNGEGVKQDYQEALKWYRKAAEQDYADAQLILGAMHYVGQGVEQDKVKAFEWWSQAARQGNEAARKSLDMLCEESPWACRQDNAKHQ
jgi:TPR repeat protein